MAHLQGKDFDIELNKRTNILTCRYGEMLCAETTAYVYNASQRLVWDHGVENLKGIIFDFTQVQHATENNRPTVKTFSDRINSRMDFSNVPVALIVSNLFQRDIVSQTLKNSSGQHRKRIVGSYEEAHQIIEDWHNQVLRV